MRQSTDSKNELNRCSWVDLNNPLYIDYHDHEWGVPVHDDKKLFEMLVLEGAQAGLSWSTVLKKKENYRKAFLNWNIKKIALFTDKDVENLLQNPGLIRNKLKVNSVIRNAKIFIDIQEEFGSFDKYLWSFVNFKPMVNEFKTIKDIPAHSSLSDRLSKDLKKRGMNFVGSTIIYAFMQAIGMTNDHTVDCFRYNELC